MNGIERCIIFWRISFLERTMMEWRPKRYIPPRLLCCSCCLDSWLEPSEFSSVNSHHILTTRSSLFLSSSWSTIVQCILPYPRLLSLLPICHLLPLRSLFALDLTHHPSLLLPNRRTSFLSRRLYLGMDRCVRFDSRSEYGNLESGGDCDSDE